MKHRFYPTLAAAAGLTLVLSACGSGGTSSGASGGEPATDGTFRFALQADPGALNPIMSAASATAELSRLAYDYLIYQDPDTSEVGPWLAEKWEETPTSASFTIRDGVTCTDGSTLTPQTVADNINFVANPDNGSQLRGSSVPTGATATAGPATRSVTVTTPEPSPFLLLNVGRLPILCEAGLKDPTASNKKSLGTGMFEVTEVAANDHYTFQRREGYNWGPDGTTSDTPGVPKTVVAAMSPNVSTAANQLLSGELNAAPIAGPDKDRVAAANLDSVGRPLPAGQMYFNQIASNPTSDPAVRKALIQAVDLDDLTQVITAGHGSGQPASSPSNRAPAFTTLSQATFRTSTSLPPRQHWTALVGPPALTASEARMASRSISASCTTAPTIRATRRPNLLSRRGPNSAQTSR